VRRPARDAVQLGLDELEAELVDRRGELGERSLVPTPAPTGDVMVVEAQ
jgi:hypothetical protein